MESSPIILVPGFWLGAWAWDDVAALLRADGHDVTALTLPGLDPGADPSSVSFADHVDAIVVAVEAAPRPPVVAFHSGAGFPGYAATDRVPERIAAVVYVDSGPGKGAMDAEFAGDALPLAPWDELGENLDGLSDEQLATFRERAVPQPGNVLRGSAELTNDARRGLPTTMICTGYTSDEYKDAIANGYAFVSGVPELKDVTFVDLPTSHWPMWSRPKELADVLSEVARRAGGG